MSFPHNTFWVLGRFDIMNLKEIKFLFLILLFCFITYIPVQGQEFDTIPNTSIVIPKSDSIVQDTILQVEDVKVKSKYPNPKKAAFLSLAIPGGGQIYNKRWWKLPLVYGALGGVIYAIDYNTGFYNRFRVALIAERDDNKPHEFDGLSIDNEQSLLNLRNEFDKNRQLAYVGLVAVYALTAVEAFVDAHLKNFDIDEDLSFQVKPQLETIPIMGQTLMGLSVSIPLDQKKPQEQPKVFFLTE